MIRERLSLILLIVLILGTLYLVITYTTYFVNRSAKESFKKLYNRYSQVLDMTVRDLGGNTECYFSTDVNVPNNFSGCDEFYEKFTENLKVEKFCKDNSLSKGCLPKYRQYNTDPSCEGFSKNSMTKTAPTYVMRDRSTLTVFNFPANSPKPAFAIDSNGKIFPNKPGYDLFSLVIVRNVNGYYTFHPNVTYCLPVGKDGIHQLQDVYK